MKGFKAKDLPPLTIRNERRVLEKIYGMAKEMYEGFDTTLEEDAKMLEEELTFN